VKVDRPASETPDLAARLRAAGLEPGSWSNGPHDRYAAHDHSYDKVLVVASGSITFGLPDFGRSVDLATGDRLDLPAGTRHDAVVGGSGVTCLEAHVPAGTFAAATLRASGEW
jgi:mannose-6-phosphate isomerase-like protein (cupin superfamily)